MMKIALRIEASETGGGNLFCDLVLLFVLDTGLRMAQQEGFLTLSGKGHDKVFAGVTETHEEELHHNGFAVHDDCGLATVGVACKSLLAGVRVQWIKS